VGERPYADDGEVGAAELHDVHADGPEVEHAGPGAPHAGDEDVDDAAVRTAGHDAARRPPEVVRARDGQPAGAGRADEVDAAPRLHERTVVLEPGAGWDAAVGRAGAGPRVAEQPQHSAVAQIHRGREVGGDPAVGAVRGHPAEEAGRVGTLTRTRSPVGGDRRPAAGDDGPRTRMRSGFATARASCRQRQQNRAERSSAQRDDGQDRALRTPQPVADRSAPCPRDPQLCRRGGDGGDRAGNRRRRGDRPFLRAGRASRLAADASIRGFPGMPTGVSVREELIRRGEVGREFGRGGRARAGGAGGQEARRDDPRGCCRGAEAARSEGEEAGAEAGAAGHGSGEAAAGRHAGGPQAPPPDGGSHGPDRASGPRHRRPGGRLRRLASAQSARGDGRRRAGARRIRCRDGRVRRRGARVGDNALRGVTSRSSLEAHRQPGR